VNGAARCQLAPSTLRAAFFSPVRPSVHHAVHDEREHFPIYIRALLDELLLSVVMVRIRICWLLQTQANRDSDHHPPTQRLFVHHKLGR
jgi:hypothetical protein